MSRAQRKTKTVKLVIAEHHRVITKDDVARRAYELSLARGRAEGHVFAQAWGYFPGKTWNNSMTINPQMAGKHVKRMVNET
jgi:hypothetical protein